MQVGQVHHIAVKCWDVEVLAGFYQLLFGFDPERRFEDEFGLRSIWLRHGHLRLMFERSEVGGSTNRSFDEDPIGLHLLAFQIGEDEHTAWKRILDEAGCPVVHETEHTIYLQDPEGNRVGLSSYAL